jgi:hypothetical protein
VVAGFSPGPHLSVEITWNTFRTCLHGQMTEGVTALLYGRVLSESTVYANCANLNQFSVTSFAVM